MENPESLSARGSGVAGATYLDTSIEDKVLQAGCPEALLQRLCHMRLVNAQAVQRLPPQTAPPLIYRHLQRMLCVLAAHRTRQLH